MEGNNPQTEDNIEIEIVDQITSIQLTVSNYGSYSIIEVVSVNGYPPNPLFYNYEWTGPNGFTSTEINLTNVTVAGGYTLTVTSNLNADNYYSQSVTINPQLD